MATKNIKLSDITVDNDIQPRISLNQHVVKDYTERIKAGDTFPPVVVIDDGKKKWLSDGFHRHRANKDLRRATIEAIVRKGTKRDAILEAIKANAYHGLRFSNADKRKVVERLLKDAEWKKLSNRRLAEMSGTSEYLVRTCIEDDGGSRTTTKVITKGGKEQEMDTSGIGGHQKEQAKEKEKEPESPATEPEKKSWTAADDEPLSEDETPVSLSSDEKVDAEGKSPLADMPFDVKGKVYRALNLLYTVIKEVEDVKGIFGESLGQVKASASDGIDELGSIPSELRQGTVKTLNGAREWIRTGTMKGTGRGSQTPKNAKDIPSEAHKLVKLWEDTIGFPPTAKNGDVVSYAKALHDIVRIDGQEWEVVEEIIVGAKMCWVDEGIPLASPKGLRDPVKSKSCKKWESIWDSYRRHPAYKPLRPVPKCPECGKGLTKGQVSRNNRKYMTYICPKHPEKSIALGKKFMPQKLVKD